MTITAVVLTLNERLHLGRCIQSLQGLVERVIVVDSGSSDGTQRLAKKLGCDVYPHPWVTHATQFNWALDHGKIRTPWVLRIDADEYLMPELIPQIQGAIREAPPEVSGFTCNRRIVFLGRWIRHGGVYPRKMLRLFRFGHGRCEERWMDEHIVVDGDVHHIDADFVDENLKNLTWWTDKHNGYASREVVDMLLTPTHANTMSPSNPQARAIRLLKEQVYSRLPVGVRPTLGFAYRYLMRFGFLDGWQGMVFHGLQGYWYRFLVDAKFLEIQRLIATESLTKEDAIEKLFGYRV